MGAVIFYSISSPQPFLPTYKRAHVHTHTCTHTCRETAPATPCNLLVVASHLKDVCAAQVCCGNTIDFCVSSTPFFRGGMRWR